MKVYNKIYFLVALGATVIMPNLITAAPIFYELVNNTKKPIYYALGTYPYNTQRSQAQDEVRKNNLIPLYTKSESDPDKKNRYFRTGTLMDGVITQLLISVSVPTKASGVAAQLYEFDPRKLANKTIYIQVVDPLKPLEVQSRSLFNPLGKSELGDSLSKNITQQELNNAYVGLADYRGK